MKSEMLFATVGVKCLDTLHGKIAKWVLRCNFFYWYHPLKDNVRAKEMMICLRDAYKVIAKENAKL
ncbi:hypothetical protein ES288_D07G231200v1 [Gossypium darwinii]|uniref:Uncharacterized protein n=1 Tax=Gossypium darwinii TaxID=34276 RepID=A0A5D2BYM6_GOSDA|nr:hypothetical protein ES288_D07G231200v1 [Gossypium darwinii]